MHILEKQNERKIYKLPFNKYISKLNLRTVKKKEMMQIRGGSKEIDDRCIIGKPNKAKSRFFEKMINFYQK